MKDTLALITLNENIEGPYWKIRFQTDWKSFEAGQFVMLEIPGGAFLRRPFGIAQFEKGEVELCYKVVGRSTEFLTKVEKGTKTRVIGPIGRGFKFSSTDKDEEHFLVAGGYGIAPIFGLAKSLRGAKLGATLFYGARTKEDLLYTKEVKKTGTILKLATEDGSEGFKGLVTEELIAAISAAKGKVHIYACGPNAMLKAIKDLTDNSEKVKSCQLSLEEYMACGVGVCSGCVVKDAHGHFVRVCTEGPVFDSSEIKL